MILASMLGQVCILSWAERSFQAIRLCEICSGNRASAGVDPPPRMEERAIDLQAMTAR